MDFNHLRPLLDNATVRLLATAETLEHPHETASLLPEWTQAHVLTHLARNADGMRNLFLAARTGEFVAMYASPEIRSADIAAGATRERALLVLDVRVAAERLMIELDAMPATAWEAAVPMSADVDALRIPATMLALFRLAEVELHHVDLGAGTDFELVPGPALDALVDVCHLRMHERTPPFNLRVPASGRSWVFGDDEPQVTVQGAAHAAVAWLTGRGAGSELQAVGSASLPELPSY